MERMFKGATNKKNKRPSHVGTWKCNRAVSLVLLLLLMNVSKGASALEGSAADNETKVEAIKPLSVLYKCGANIEESVLNLPGDLRVDYSYYPPDLEYFANFYSSLFTYELIEKSPGCRGEIFELEVSTRTGLLLHPSNSSQMARLSFTPHGFMGYLSKPGDKVYLSNDEIYYDRDNYCISRLGNGSMSLKLCKSKCYHDAGEYGDHLCIPKCCPLGAVMSPADDGVIECALTPSGYWKPEVYCPNTVANKRLPRLHPQMHYNDNPEVIDWGCKVKVFSLPASDVRILADGRILTRKPNKSHELAWEQQFDGQRPVELCVDGFWNGSSSSLYDPDAPDGVLLFKWCENQGNESKVFHWHTSGLNPNLAEYIAVTTFRTKLVFLLVWLPCVLIQFFTLVVHLCLWDKQNAHGWAVMALTLTQVLVYSFYCLFHGYGIFTDETINLESTGLCVLAGIFYHFLVVSVYTWTVVITFDVWTKLSSMQLSSQTSKGTKRFLCYAAFAVGIPLLVVIIAISVEYSSRDSCEGHMTAPGYHIFCLITDPTAYLLYVFVPTGLLFVANLGFAILTFQGLWEANRNVSVLKNQDSTNSGSSDSKAVLIGKMMLLMGFLLVFQFIVNMFSLYRKSQYFALLEVYHILYSLGTFWIFVCSKRTMKQLREKYPKFMSNVPMIEGSSSVQRRSIQLKTTSDSYAAACSSQFDNNTVKAGDGKASVLSSSNQHGI